MRSPAVARRLYGDLGAIARRAGGIWCPPSGGPTETVAIAAPAEHNGAAA